MLPEGDGADSNLLNDILDEDDLLDFGDEEEGKLARQNSRDSLALKRQKSIDR